MTPRFSMHTRIILLLRHQMTPRSSVHTRIILLLCHHLLSYTALDLPVTPWAKISLAMPHNIAEVTNLYWLLTVTLHLHLLHPVSVTPNGQMPQKVHRPYLTSLKTQMQRRKQAHHHLLTRQKTMGTIDWTPIFVRGYKTTLIHSETSVTKKIIRDLSLGYVPCCYSVTCLIFRYIGSKYT